MAIELLFKIITWIIIWFGVWTLDILVLLRNRQTYARGPIINSLVYLLSSMLVVWIFNSYFSQLVSRFFWWQVLIPVLVIVLVYISFKLIHKYRKLPKSILRRNKWYEFLTLQSEIIPAKTTELIFQQVMLVWLIGMWLAFGFDTGHILLGSIIVFGGAHLPLLLAKGQKLMTVFFYALLS